MSVYLPDATGPATQHSVGQQINYVASGNHALDRSPTAFTTQTQSWYFIDAVDVVRSHEDLGTLVTFGDSITDGVNSTVNANARWPNDLARRLDDTEASRWQWRRGDQRRPRTHLRCVLRGERLARFDRDVVGRAGRGR